MCVGVLCCERAFVCCVFMHRRTLWKKKHVGLEFSESDWSMLWFVLVVSAQTEKPFKKKKENEKKMNKRAV